MAREVVETLTADDEAAGPVEVGDGPAMADVFAAPVVGNGVTGDTLLGGDDE